MRIDSLQPFANTVASVKSLRALCKQVVFCLILACLLSGHLLYALPAATTTVLQLSSGAAVGNGVVVTLTATVTSTGTGKPVSPGFVTFCDASAKFCEDLAVLGSTAINSSGVASMKKVLPPGTHRISAFFNQTVSNATSISSTQTVDVPVQSKALPVPIITKIGTSNPLPVQASVSVVGTAPLTGTLSIVQDQGRQALVSAAIEKTSAQSGFAPLVVTPTSEYTSGNAPVTADLDGDGLLDMVVSAYNEISQSDVPSSLQIALNDPAHPGHFVLGQKISIAGIYLDGPLIGDFNNDGIPDLIVRANTTDYTFTVYPGDPAHPGQFLTGSSGITTSPNGYYQLVADLNQDGVLDLIGSNSNGDIDILFGDPDHPGHFINETIIPNGYAPVSVISDLNGDGVLDLIGSAPYDAGSPALQIMFGDPASPGHFLKPVTYAVPSINSFLDGQFLVGDFNEDGQPDIAFLETEFNGTGGFFVLLNSPNSPGQLQAPVKYTVTEFVGGLLGDFNGDGTLDLVQSDFPGPGLSLLPGDAKNKGTFLPRVSFPLPQEAYPSTSGDFNADGITDLNIGVTSYEKNAEYGNYSPFNPLLAQLTQTATASFPGVAYDSTKSPLAQALYSGDDNYGMIGSCNIDLAENPGAPVLYDIHADVSNTAATVLWYWHGAVGAVDYGTTASLGSTTGFQTAEPSQLNGPSYIRLTGLASGTKYYYRIRAIDYYSGCSHWTTTSPTETFTTTQ